jgi:hypothetical protein
MEGGGMAEWVKAAEVQLELHRWMTSEIGQRWIRGWVSAESQSDPAKGDMYGLLAHAEPMKLLTADAIWVAPEMSDLIDAAREGFQAEPMEREDFITHTGFLYFAKPIYMLDRNRRKVSIGAISWCPTVFKRAEDDPDTSGYLVAKEGSTALYAESSSEDRTLSEREDKWGMAIAMYSSANAEEDDFSHHHRAMIAQSGGPELISLHYTAVKFGDVLDDGELLDTEGRYTGADEWWKAIQTTLRLMQQRVATATDERLPRATRRRAERQGHAVSEVTVIRLRRPTTKHDDEEGSSVEWTHRWIVDGHWRNQWYPSLNRHRQVWISPYVKGPDDMPLVVKRRFYKWDR